MKFINEKELKEGFKKFHGNIPYDHCVIDDFLTDETLKKINEEFLNYNSEKWFFYNNAIECKKACNDWNTFGPITYSLFSFLNSEEFVGKLSSLTGSNLIADMGLHGGGLHCHGLAGNLNPHLDYSIHPKLELQRVINIIIYVSKELNISHGGHLGLWEHNKKDNKPGELRVSIAPKYNRAVIFNTTQNSWHGMCEPLLVQEGIYRKSLAIYYLQKPSSDALKNKRAMFAAREEQKDDKAIEKLIKLRSQVDTSHLVYRGEE